MRSDDSAAFPQSGYEQWSPQAGMTLRDYFAAKAMQVAYAGHAPEHLAQVSYKIADAMLAERAK